MKDTDYVGSSMYDKAPQCVQLHKLIWQTFGMHICQSMHALFRIIYEKMKPIELKG